MTIFTKIIRREIPADIVYEDELCIAFRDIHPQAPVHVLLVPKKEISSMKEVSPEDAGILGHLMVKAAQIAKEQRIGDGFRLMVNSGESVGQTVFHLHIHILGGAVLSGR